RLLLILVFLVLLILVLLILVLLTLLVLILVLLVLLLSLFALLLSTLFLHLLAEAADRQLEIPASVGVAGPDPQRLSERVGCLAEEALRLRVVDLRRRHVDRHVGGRRDRSRGRGV